MTTGPEHYEGAVTLLGRGVDWTDDIDAMPDELTVDQRIALRQAETADAQVRATLALAAAIALKPGRYDHDNREVLAWKKVAGARS